MAVFFFFFYGNTPLTSEYISLKPMERNAGDNNDKRTVCYFIYAYLLRLGNNHDSDISLQK